MNEFALRLFVRNLITEAKDQEPKKKESEEKKSNKKEDNKLVNLKKELTAKKEALSKVEEYRDNLQAAKFAEKVGGEEFAERSGFAKELNSLNAKGIALEQEVENTITKIKGEITALEEKTLTEINKIKEMMGLVPKEGQEEIVDEARSKKMTSAQKKKKEDIVKGMKKSDSFGKSKEEKSKMYATATKLATKK
jgi:hypothetical protein